MSNIDRVKPLSFQLWVEKNSQFLVTGIISYYSNQPFPDDRCDNYQRAVELGRLIAASASSQGMTRKSDLIRKVPNKTYYAIMKSKIPSVRQILKEDAPNCII
jgi:hypothetical protein